MWMWVKHGARAPFDLGMAERELGSTSDAVNYRRLMGDFSDVERGPDEDMASHYRRLQKALADWRAQDTSEMDRRRAPDSGLTARPGFGGDPNKATITIGPQEEEQVPDRPAPQHTPSTGRGHQVELWPDPLPSREPQASGINDAPASSLPQRDPGRALVDQMMQTDTPLPQRSPGRYAPPGPRRQTFDEWVQGLRDKGIELDENGKRPGAITDLPRRKPMPPRGRDIWGDLIRPERAQDGIVRAAGMRGISANRVIVDEWLDITMSKYAYHDNRDELGRFAPKEYRRPTQKVDKPGAYHHALREFGGDAAKALAWDRLRREHPDEPIGPDESYHDHFTRLKKKYQGGDPPKRQHNKIRRHVEKKKSYVVMLQYVNDILARIS